MKKTVLILSCEHASDFIPTELIHLLDEQDLAKRAKSPFTRFDPYAKELTMALAQHMNCPVVFGAISRLLIDLNKNGGATHCLQETINERLNETEKKNLLDTYFYQYRQAIEGHIERLIGQNNQVLHVSVHSFCPKEKGVEHNAAIGLLYDSQRSGEKEVIRVLHELLLKRTPYTVRINYPRSGRGDNYTSYLRKHLAQEDYLGIELEVNALVLENEETASLVHEDLKVSLYSLIEML
jgi:predicted N-formylglutamate amidohydrolase